MPYKLIVTCFIGLIGAGPAFAQHCGFDFTRILIVQSPMGGRVVIDSISLLHPNQHQRKTFWINPGRSTVPDRNRITADYRILDSNDFWFAGNNYVYAGHLHFDSVTPIVVHYRELWAPERRVFPGGIRPDTLFIDAAYTHSLCSNYQKWEYDTTYDSRQFFSPLVLEPQTYHNRDTIRPAFEHMWTSKLVYPIGDTVIVIRSNDHPHREVLLMTDGDCAAKVVYGIEKKVESAWRLVKSLPDIQAACGMPYAYMGGFFKTTSFSESGEYRIVFRDRNYKDFRTDSFFVR